MPGEFALGFGWVGVEDGEVAGATRSEGMGERFARNLLEGLNHLKDRGRMAGTEVVSSEAGLQAVDGGKMATGEVDNMDEITLAGAVGGVVIVTEDAELGEFAGGDFHDVGHEVVWDAVGILAEEAGCVIADRVEIAEGDNVELGVGFG